MPRRDGDDIPIRPLFGIADTVTAKNTETESKEVTKPTKTKSITKRTKNITTSCSNSRQKMSYSEIPFLARYAGNVPDVPDTKVKEIIPVEENIAANDEDSSPDDDKPGTSGSSRPRSLNCDSNFPYELERGNSREGESMHHFVAENMEDKLRSANASHNSTPSNPLAVNTNSMTQQFLQYQIPPQIDANVLSDIEIEAQYLAASVENLTENLGNLLHSISSITADNVEVHKNAVNKLTDYMDANIKCMYTIMAKTEEITKSMKPTEHLGARIREIKRLVDMLESVM